MLRFLMPMILCLALVGCDDDTTSADTQLPTNDMRNDTTGGNDAASDAVSDAVSDKTVSDTPSSPRLLGEGCCAKGASGCNLGTCSSGLTCFVVSGGPYTDRGICSKACTTPQTDCACASTTPGNRCPGGTPSCVQGNCMWLCLPDPQGCDSSQPCKCQSDLLCLDVSGKSMCLP